MKLLLCYLHDAFLVLFSLVVFFFIGQFFSSSLSSPRFTIFQHMAKKVFVFTVMVGCAVVEVYSFDLLGYMQDFSREMLWRSLTFSLCLLLYIALPSLIGIALFRKWRIQMKNQRWLTIEQADALFLLISGICGVLSLQAVLWVIIQLLPLRMDKSDIHLMGPISLFEFLFNWSVIQANLACVVLGTVVAAILGGFAAVNFPLDVFLVSKYSDQLSKVDLANVERSIRSTSKLKAWPGTNSNNMASSRYINVSTPSTPRSKFTDGGSVVKRNVPISPYPKSASDHHSETETKSSAGLSMPDELMGDLDRNLEIMKRLRQQKEKSKTILGRLERSFGATLSVWSVIRFCIGFGRALWWVGSLMIVETELHREINPTNSIHSDASWADVNAHSWIRCVFPLYVTTVAVIAFLQLKGFLQSVHQLFTLGFCFRQTALAMGCYALTSVLFLHAYAALLAEGTAWGLGIQLMNDSESADNHIDASVAQVLRQSTLLDLAIGNNVNFVLLYRIFDIVFVGSSVSFLAYLWINFQTRMRCIESLLETFRSESRANRFYNSDTLYPV